MKTLGILGGIGPESTIEYYRAVVATWQARRHDGSYPSVVINSIDLNKFIAMVATNELSQVADYLAFEVARLASAGVDCALMAANTPHLVFDEVQSRSAIKIISIVQATCDAAERMELTNLGLIGARFTMQARFYPDALAARGIELALPEEDDQSYIHEIYMEELVKGIVLTETRERLLAIVSRMKQRHGIQGLILGGTELSLILREGMAADVRFLDTTQIHVQTAVDEMLS